MPIDTLHLSVRRNGARVAQHLLPTAEQDRLLDLANSLGRLLDRLPCPEHPEGATVLLIADTDGHVHVSVPCCCWRRAGLIDAVALAAGRDLEAAPVYDPENEPPALSEQAEWLRPRIARTLRELFAGGSAGTAGE